MELMGILDSRLSSVYDPDNIPTMLWQLVKTCESLLFYTLVADISPNSTFL